MRERTDDLDTIAVISDIHGNRWALEAVLRDIDRRGIGAIVNLGDHLTGPLDPVGTAELLMARKMVNILGNDDRDLFAPAEQQSLSQRFTREQLGADQLDWLRAMPESAVVAGEVYACHGDLFDAPYLLEWVDTDGRVTMRPAADLATSVAGIAHPVVVSGHSHAPRAVGLPDGKLLVNPGSVGLPAYTMDSPVAYILEAGSPHARYATLSKTTQGWRVELVALPYRWDEAAAVARFHGRDDWAEWITTGRG